MRHRIPELMVLTGVIGIMALMYYVAHADAADVSTPQFSGKVPAWTAPVPSLINLTMPVLVAGGPCKYYSGTQYGTVPATALVWLVSIDQESDTATYKRVVYWPNRSYPNNPHDDTQDLTEYMLTIKPWNTRLDLNTAISGETYQWEAAP